MLSAILDQLKPYRAKLVAVSKRRTIPEIRAIYDQGQRDFAENRVQDLLERREALPADIRWHLIGHLQSNKVKYIADFIHLIHAVDSLGLLQEIDKRAQAAGSGIRKKADTSRPRIVRKNVPVTQVQAIQPKLCSSQSASVPLSIAASPIPTRAPGRSPWRCSCARTR